MIRNYPSCIKTYLILTLAVTLSSFSNFTLASTVPTYVSWSILDSDSGDTWGNYQLLGPDSYSSTGSGVGSDANTSAESITGGLVFFNLTKSSSTSTSGLAIYVNDSSITNLTIGGTSYTEGTLLTEFGYSVAVAGTDFCFSYAGNADLTCITLSKSANSLEIIGGASQTTTSDSTAPTLSSSTPADNATNVAIDGNVILNFSEAVDVESGNITIKKTSDNSTVETIDVTSGLVTGSGTTTITINPASNLAYSTEYYVLIDVTAFDDASSNSYAGISDTTALSFTTTAAPDTTAPTMTITAVEGSDGFTSDDATLSLTFTSSETTTNFIKDDISVTNATLGTLSGSGTTYTITLTPTSLGAVTIDVAAGAFTDAAGNNNTAATQFNWTYGIDPTAKADVIGTVEATTNAAVRFGQVSMKNIGWRFDWLRRNKDAVHKSVQGVKVAFADPLLEQYFNGDPRALDAFKLVSAKDVLQRVGTNPDAVMSDVQAVPMELAMAEAQKSFGKPDLNPTTGEVYGDWSVWTAGQVTIGDIKAKGSSVATESETLTLAIGVDKPTSDNGIIGYALNVGKDINDIGTDGTKMKSDNYSLSIYSGFETSNDLPVELALGFGHMDMRMTRIEGSQTLTGGRDAEMLFGSAKIRKAATTVDNVSVSPYAKLEAAYIRLDQYTETGGTMALHYDKQNVRRALTSFGIDVDWDVKLNEGSLHPFTNLQYTFDLSDKSDVDMNYVGDSTIYSMALKRSADRHWGAGVGMEYIHTKSGMSSMFLYQRDEAVGAGHSDTIQIKFSMPF